MITEDFCPNEVAKLLKERGLVRHEDKITHQMAMKWLREEHKISIEISSTEIGRWMVCVYELGLTRHFVEAYIGTYDTYEEAVEAAIKYSLENLI